MGYYGTFSMDFTIPSDKIAAAEAAMIKAGQNEGETDLVEMFNHWFLDIDSSYADVDALTQLAGASDGGESRGDFSAVGDFQQKWRSFVEDICEVLAPFVTPNSYLHITGEEGEKVCYRFTHGERIDDWATVIYDAERAEAVSIKDALREILSSPFLSTDATATVKAIAKKHGALQNAHG